MGSIHRAPGWVPSSLPVQARHRATFGTTAHLQSYVCVHESHRRKRRGTLCYGVNDENDLAEQLQQAILREDYDLAAKIRDDLTRERGVDVHQLRRQLDSAIDDENYNEAARIRDLLKEAGEDLSSSDENKEVTYTSSIVTRNIRVTATSAFVPQRSSPARNSYFFVYEIKIENTGGDTVQLKSRSWNITDANGKVNTVRGPGVVGKYPILGPGTSFSYTSACPLTTPTGVMEGTYDFLSLDCTEEELKSVPLTVVVAPFLLSTSVVGNINIDDT